MSNMNINWDDFRLFLQIAESGSLNRAAQKLQLTQPTLSRRLSALEEQIGEALVKRGTEGVTLTRLGEKLIKSCQSMADWAREAEGLMQKSPEKPEGKIVLTAPPGIAVDFIAPLVTKVRKKYPAIRLEVLSSVELFNLSRGEADMALRTRLPNEPGIICLDQLTIPLTVFVSKEYAKKLGPRPKLTELDWIGWPNVSEPHHATKQIKRQLSSLTPVYTADDHNAQVAACLAGVGALILPKIKNRFFGMQNLIDLEIPLGKEAVWELFFVCHKRFFHVPKFEAVSSLIKEEFTKIRSGN